MKPVTEKVLARLTFERLLAVNPIHPRRTRITLDEVLEAGKEESHILQILPAILLYKPQIIRGVVKDKRVEKLKRGAEEGEPRQIAETFKQFLDRKKTGQKSLTVTFRMAPEDIERLKRLTHELQTGSVSETIRLLAREREVGIRF